jgi:hypothetical protein
MAEGESQDIEQDPIKFADSYREVRVLVNVHIDIRCAPRSTASRPITCKMRSASNGPSGAVARAGLPCIGSARRQGTRLGRAVCATSRPATPFTTSAAIPALLSTRSEKTGGIRKAISPEATAVSKTPTSRPAVAVANATAPTARKQPRISIRCVPITLA